MLNLLRAGTFLTSLSFVSSVALAAQPSDQKQQPAAPSSQAESSQPILEEIIVTGDRKGFGAGLVQVGTFRNARIVDVPLTVAVVSQEMLVAQAVTGIFDALRNTAGVSRSQTNGTTFDNVAVRGINLENRTSFRLNGSLPIINLVDLPLENKDRVEVLKGVGALYYGYAPPSGIVNLVTKRATKDINAFTVSGNEYAGGRVTADVGRRLTNSFGLRFNGSAGVIENGIRNVGGRRYMASGAADWDISRTLKLRFDAEHIYKNVTEPANIGLAAVNSALVPPAVPGKRTLPPIPDPEVNLGGEDIRTSAHATNFMGRADIRLSDQFAVTLEGGQAITERSRLAATFQNYDLRPTSPTYGEGVLNVARTRNQRYRNRNARAELAGAFATGPVIHNLIVGASINWRFQNGRSSTNATTPQNYFKPRNATIAAPTVFTDAPLNIKDKGIYAVDRAKFGPVELLVGARYSDYKSRLVAANGTVSNFAKKTLSPSYGVILKPAKQYSLYGTYLQGLEEVSPAPLNSAFPLATLPPAASTQYEFGFKGEPRRGVNFQIAAFRINRPSAIVDPVDNVYKLAGRARYQGVEASVGGEISRELSLNVSGQYLDAKIINAVPITLVGNVPENTPKYTGTVFAEYRPNWLPNVAMGAGAFYVSERAVNNFEEAFVPGYTTYSASLRYSLPNMAKGMTIQLNADNLLNKAYWAGTSQNVISTGAPRLVKLTLSLGL